VHNPIIVALDLADPARALQLADELAPLVGAFKVGSELFTCAGPEIVREIRSRNASVFLDLKFHDIPNTVSGAVRAAVNLDVQMLTVHTSGGLEMLRAAETAALETAANRGRPAPLLLGVTVLTSMDSRALTEIGAEANIGRQVERLAGLAREAGLRGLVCSPLEVVSLRQFLPAEMQLVTPGIRVQTSPADDQKRTLSAREALDLGANWLVIGRPITTAPNPRQAIETILQSLGR
jgi:orotidine-5'-phosphate decarboxylase